MRHYEASAVVDAPPEQVFQYVDDHARFSSHMNKSKWMTAGGRMKIEFDEARGQKVGSHIRMGGRFLGMRLYLDEVVAEHNPPRLKAWETTGETRLLVIGAYRMTVAIRPDGAQSRLHLSIDYGLPKSNPWLGRLFGRVYAKWCVRQILGDARRHFAPGAPKRR